MRPGTLFFQCACINLRNEDMRFMSVELYKNVFNQALTEVRQICAPRSPRREDTDFDIRTINKLDCLNFVYIPPREHHLHGVLAPRSRGFSATLYGAEHHPL